MHVCMRAWGCCQERVDNGGTLLYSLGYGMETETGICNCSIQEIRTSYQWVREEKGKDKSRREDSSQDGEGCCEIEACDALEAELGEKDRKIRLTRTRS